jgi:hypothetical protein
VFSVLMLLVFAGNPFPKMDQRIESLQFSIEGEAKGFAPDGTAITEYFAQSHWSGEIRYHRDGAMSWEWQDGFAEGKLKKFSTIHGGESHQITTTKGKPSQSKLPGDMGAFFKGLRKRELPDAWPTLFGPYNPFFYGVTPEVSKRVEKLNGVDYDVFDVSTVKDVITTRYWFTKDAYPNVVQWEEFKMIGGKSLLVQRCEIKLGKVPLGQDFFTFPIESARSVLISKDFKTKAVTQLKTPQQVFYTRINPASMKLNTIKDRDSLQFAFDDKSKVLDFTKPQPVGKTVLVKDRSLLKPSDPETTSKALLEREHGGDSSWLWLLFAGLGLISVVVGFILWRRS